MSRFEDFSDDFNNFFEAVFDFSHNRITENKLSSLIRTGLNVLCSFPNYMGLAFFAINNETFEFEMKEAMGALDVNTWYSLHDSLVESGTIGSALMSGRLVHYSLPSSKELYVIPLVSLSGPIGIIELASEKDTHIDLQYINLTNLYANYFSGSINEFMLKENEKRNQEMVDQLVASRTIRIEKSKHELGEKIENIKSSISMAIPHEVRTPINQILGFSNYLIQHFVVQEGVSEDLIEYITDIKNSAERLKRLFENYLYYAKLTVISSDISELSALRNFITISAESYIYESIMIKASYFERMEEIRINLVEGSLAMSEEYLSKIVEELMDNALKYSEPGNGISVDSHIESEMYYIRFIDKGRGMTEEQIAQIDAYIQFDRHYYEQQGSGLGLTIVRRILDLHAGKFSIESKLNEYTKVEIGIPIAKNDYSLEY